MNRNHDPVSTENMFHDILDVSCFYEFPVIHNTDAVAHLCQLRQNMGTDHNGFSHAAQILQKFFHLHTRTRVQTGIRFIQHQKGRIVDECPCHTQPLLHSAGKRIHINLFFV